MNFGGKSTPKTAKMDKKSVIKSETTDTSSWFI